MVAQPKDPAAVVPKSHWDYLVCLLNYTEAQAPAEDPREGPKNQDFVNTPPDLKTPSQSISAHTVHWVANKRRPHDISSTAALNYF